LPAIAPIRKPVLTSNLGRKLRERLEELERQAGETSSVVATALKTPKTTKPRSNSASSATSATTGGRVTKRTRANSARTTRNNSSGLTLQVPRTRSAEPVSATTASDYSPITPTALEPYNSRPSTRNYYGGDFGPLFTTIDVQPNTATAGGAGFQPTQWDSAAPQYQPPAIMYSSPNLGHMPASPQDMRPIGGYCSEAIAYGAEYPELPSTYSANPSVNPNPFHLNPPLPRDNFYVTLGYNKLMNAAFQVGKILNVDPADYCKDEALSPFHKSEPWSIPENAEDLQPTQRQLEVPHHPYIDIIPFKGLRDCMLDYVEEGDRTGDYLDEEEICIGFHQSVGVWGDTPWDGQSYEASEDFIR
jgi:hypothetical protein